MAAVPPPGQRITVPARIIRHDDGTETLSTGEPLYLQPLVRTRANNSPFALHDACEIGDLLFVKAFFAQGPLNAPRNQICDPSVINRRDLYAQTPIHLAILNGRYEIAKILLENGAEPRDALEGMTQLQVLLSLVGSFPQFQVSMVQPTPHLLQTAVNRMSKSMGQGGPADLVLPTPNDIVIDPRFLSFTSFAVRMTALLIDALRGSIRDIYKRDDNGRSIFHYVAQYDLVEPFLVLVDRLFADESKMRHYLLDDNRSTMSEAEIGAEIQQRRVYFCNQLLGQDNQQRNVFHYCAQYRSYHVLDKIWQFVLQNAALFPKVGQKTLAEIEERQDFFFAHDVYSQTPLHYAYYYAAPFYSRPAKQPLGQVIGKYYPVDEVEQSGLKNAQNGSKPSSFVSPPLPRARGHEFDTPELIANRNLLQGDPIVAKFIKMGAELEDGIVHGLPGYSRLSHLLGNHGSFDLYNRIPYQSAVFNQPVSGANNAGVMVPVNNDKSAMAPGATIKPTLLGWSPRCFEHFTAPRITRRDEAPPPENVRRLQVLLNFTDGVLRSNEFNHRVSQTDILALNHLYYTTLIEQLGRAREGVEKHPLNEIQTMTNIYNTATSICDSTILRSPNQLPVPQTDGFVANLLNTPVVPQNVLHWNHRAPRATFSDILRCHEFGYLHRLMAISESIDEQDDWSGTTTEVVDVLHRDLHMSVPNITSLPVYQIKKTFNTSTDFYFNVLQQARDLALLPPHELKDATNAMNGAAGAVALMKKKKDAILTPEVSVAQSLLYRERCLLNLNMGFANLSLPPYMNTTAQGEEEVLELRDRDPATALKALHLRNSLLADANELYDSALFPAQVRRELERNSSNNIIQWRAKLTPAIYTNSIIQSSSLVNVLYHYPNYNAISDQIDPLTGYALTAADNEGMQDGTDFAQNVHNSSHLDQNQLIKLRERTSTFAGELSSTTPAPSLTRHIPPPIPLRNIDGDTAISAFSWFAALYACGTVIDAIKRVIAGQYKNAFCAVRPPGHHSGPAGLVTTDDNIGDSHGFCLLNNVAVGAAFAKAMYPDLIKRVAIIDFDVHHGNGTEAIVSKLQPQVVTKTIQLSTNPQFGTVDRIAISRHAYSPWYDADDIDDVFFASVHGYYKTSHDQFYPGTGATTDGLLETLVDQNRDPYRIIAQSMELTQEEKLQFFSNSITSRSSAVDLLQRYIERRDNEQYVPSKPYVSPILVDIFDGDEKAALDHVRLKRPYQHYSRQQQESLAKLYTNTAEIADTTALAAKEYGWDEQPLSPSDVATPLHPGDLPTDLPIHMALEKRKLRIINAGLGKQTRNEWRKVWTHSILPGLVAHNPDLIMISAGFDAHARDKMNSGHIGIDEDDYYWITKQLMKVANLCCEGRIVSCLEGGYRIHCGLMSPFSRSVAAHVRALHEGGNEAWLPEEVDVEVEMNSRQAALAQALQALIDRENAQRREEEEGHGQEQERRGIRRGGVGDEEEGRKFQNFQNNVQNGQNGQNNAQNDKIVELAPTEALDTNNIISSSGRSTRQRAKPDFQAAAKAMALEKKQRVAAAAAASASWEAVPAPAPVSIQNEQNQQNQQILPNVEQNQQNQQIEQNQQNLLPVEQNVQNVQNVPAPAQTEATTATEPAKETQAETDALFQSNLMQE